MGVDVFDGSGTIDWTTAKGAGVDFAIIKASQGTYDDDSQFAANWSGAKAAGVVRGAYHFLDPTESGTAQAQFFLGIVGTLEATDLPPVLDIECPTSNDEPNSDNCLGQSPPLSGDATGAAITTIMNDWLTAVKTATGKTPIVYSFGSYFAGDGIDTTGLEDYPLYIAYPTTSDCFEFPDPWTAATFWQYNQNGTIAGIGSGTDLDYFLGTSAQLTAFAASGAAPMDAGLSSSDAGEEDAGTPCVVTTTGESGECMLTSDCAALGGHTSTPGYCPGPDDIECCTSNGGTTEDAGGTRTDASMGHTGKVDGGSHPAPMGDSDATTKPKGSVLEGGPGSGPDGARAADGGDEGEFASGSSGGCSCGAAGREGSSATGPSVLAVVLGGASARRRRKRPAHAA
jgi:lysozyme